MKKTFTVVRKWAEEKGYEVVESTYRQGVYTIIASDKIKFKIENKESTIYYSIHGQAGNPAGIYLTTIRAGERTYSRKVDSQRNAIEIMVEEIEKIKLIEG